MLFIHFVPPRKAYGIFYGYRLDLFFYCIGYFPTDSTDRKAIDTKILWWLLDLASHFCFLTLSQVSLICALEFCEMYSICDGESGADEGTWLLYQKVFEYCYCYIFNAILADFSVKS